MDSWIMDYVKDTLSNSPISDFIPEHVFARDSPVNNLVHHVTSILQSAWSTLSPVLYPLLNRLYQALNSSPDIVLIGVFGLVLVLAFQVLSWMRRVLAFWTRLAFRMTFYAGLVALGASVWQRGLEASWADAVSVAGALVKYGGWVKDIWVNEYRKYEEQGQKSRGGYSGAQAGGWRSR